ncbi:MAG TPA: hypothetical protein VFF73_21175 [Planctomycetota bacterium]|nr:hypothetical protein [Planctomycetota bacterium]
MRGELLALVVLLAACDAKRGFAPVEGPDLATLAAPVRVEDPLLARRGATLGLDGAGERLLSIDTEGPTRLSLGVERLEAPLRIVLEPRTFPRARLVDSVIVELAPGELSLGLGSRRELRPRSRVSRSHDGKPARLDIAVDAREARVRYGSAELSLHGVEPGPAELVFSVEASGPSAWPPRDAPVVLADLRVAGTAPAPLDALARANALLACGKAAEAEPVYAEALASSTSLRALRRGRALALLESGKPGEAALDLARAEALDPRLAPALGAAVDALLASGELALAVEAALEASRLARPHEDRAAGKFFQTVVERARARAPSESDPVKRARAFAASRDLADLARAEAALELAPDGVERHIALAEVLRFEAGVLRERQDETWRSTYGRAALELDRARANAPQDERVLRGLGIIAFLLGKTQEAVSLLDRATRADERSYEAWLFLGRAQADPALAVKALDRACTLHPLSGGARVFRALAREKAGDDAGARKDLEAARQLGSTHVSELATLEERLR